MKRVIALFLVILPGLAIGQVSPFFDQLVNTSPIQPSEHSVQKLNHFVRSFHEKETRSEKKLLKSIVKATHQKFLKVYSPYVDFTETLEKGRFDCLTATSLLSVVLSETHFQYSIIETNYHIFILVNTSQGQVLVETTDRLFGFIDDPVDISRKIASYRKTSFLNAGSDKTHYQYSFNLLQQVRPDQLAGLLYFNQAIKAYNRHDLLACASLLEQSRKIYESPRVDELAIVLVKSVLESDLSPVTKGRVLQQYKSYVFSTNSPVASR